MPFLHLFTCCPALGRTRFLNQGRRAAVHVRPSGARLSLAKLRCIKECLSLFTRPDAASREAFWYGMHVADPIRERTARHTRLIRLAPSRGRLCSRPISCDVKLMSSCRQSNSKRAQSWDSWEGRELKRNARAPPQLDAISMRSTGERASRCPPSPNNDALC